MTKCRAPKKHRLFGIALALSLAWVASAEAGEIDPEQWADYLDYAYVYSSADAKTLEERIALYGRDAGITLDDYMVGYLGSASTGSVGLSDEKIRRKAIGFLIQYLVSRDARLVERSAETIAQLQGEDADLEDQYWHHYIMAHRAMEKSDSDNFVRENLDLWLDVVMPMETAFETFDSLSLSQSANSGFTAALPYVFENVARMILIRSQEMSLNKGLDPLASIVRLLHSDRVGAHPDVIPAAASVSGYLDRIVARLDGAESDAGSLTYTLALFEASKLHDDVRSRLASEGFSQDTLKAIRVSTGAYQVALARAATVQGKAAVHVRILRQMGEIYAAKQRLEVDPPVAMPIGIEDAILVYDELFQHREGNGWALAGYGAVGRDAYVEALHRLWEEIQEASLNIADYYLARSVTRSGGADDDVRSAAQMYSRYLAFFKQYAEAEESLAVPNSAYFAAYEAARGYADAHLRFANSKLRSAEAELVAQRYLTAIKLYPFDRSLWPGLADAVDRLGRSQDYLGLARPAAHRVASSRHLDNWVSNKEANAREVATARNGLANDMVLMYLGFASQSGMAELEQSLEDLTQQRDEVSAQLSRLTGSPAAGSSPGPAAAAPSVQPLDRQREMTQTKASLAKLERRVEARARALPLYRALRDTDGLIEELRSRRDHPVHVLLRRMYYEKSS